MKRNTLRSRKPAARKRRKAPFTPSPKIERKISPEFADQIAAFIKRYRPALQALAKR